MKLDKDLNELGKGDFFVKDIFTDDLLYGVTIRSSIPKGKIKALMLPALPADYVAVTSQDIPGENSLTLFNDSMPFLATTEVDYIGQPVLLLAGPDKHALRTLAKQVKIQYKEETAVTYPGEALAFHTVSFSKGNSEEIFKNESGSFKLVAGEYKTGFHSTYRLLTQSVLAIFESKKNLVIFTPSEYPFHVRQSAAALLSLPAQRIRVITPYQGYGSGDNLIYPSLLAGHCALLSYVTKKPVKMLFELEDELLNTPCKYPCSFKLRSALDQGGRLCGLEAEISYDTGAYALLTPFILERIAFAAGSPYQCEHVSIKARAYKTNQAPAFSFSALGEDLALFAGELHATKVAAAAEQNPFRWRQQNLVKAGGSLVLGQKIPKGENISLILEDVVRRSDFERKYSAYEANRKGRTDYLSPEKPLWGIGLALAFHGIGVQGSWEERFPSQIKVVFEPQKKLRLYSSFVGPWQEYFLKASAKKFLNLEDKDISLAIADTAFVPDTGPSIGSRLHAVIAHLIEQSCHDLARKREQARLPLEVKHKFTASKQPVWSSEELNGNFYTALCWEATVVEVVVDPLSFKPGCKRIWTTIDAGQVSDYERLMTEVEGSVVKNLEFALLSRSVKAASDSDSFPYHLSGLNSRNKPEISIVFWEPEASRKHAVFKGVGEQGVLGVAPAFTAAVSQALGLSLTELPLTADRLDKLTSEALSVDKV